MSFHVRTLPKARQDIVSILDWLLYDRQTPAGAAAWKRAYDTAAASLKQFPERHGLAIENDYVDETLRQFFFKTRRGRTYRGVFTIVGDEVFILRVRGPGQAAVEPDELT